MQRGSRSLFSDFLIEIDNASPTERSIGRNPALAAQRDTRLVHRHYYYLKILKLQYPDILSNLSLEFDISEYRIIISLQKEDNYRLLRRLINEKLTVDQLRKQYPFLIWKPRMIGDNIN